MAVYFNYIYFVFLSFLFFIKEGFVHLNPKERSWFPWCLPTSRMGLKPFNFALILFSPANSMLEEKDTVGEESNFSLELSLSCDSMSSSRDKGKEDKKNIEVGESNSYEHQRKDNCWEKESDGLCLELSDASLGLFPSGEYTFMFKGKSDATDEGKQERFEIGECSNQYQRKEHEHKAGDLSLQLSLGFSDSTCTSKKREGMENPSSARRISSCRNKRIKVDREEASMLFLTELRLGHDPWCIKKTLTGSDLGNMSRLMLASECVEHHVFPFWNADQLAKVKEGLPVSVWDCDTNTEHELVFKRWNKGANVLIKNWVKDFVKRRELKLGDEIGLYWNTCNSRFQFAVLNRVARN
ncbi:AP2/B3 transcriptional factor family protein [Theobroma cacao]|uniref:AP2/B3 transcriptional factor family protein n=1 Tax=Theobroma cacao TaxID=3641 RepID=A0A061DJW6_THECC|nr:AP2/B3 transcriptional factor family protein [Theobroma cacao]